MCMLKEVRTAFIYELVRAIAAFSRNQTTTYFGDDLPVLELDLSDPLTADDLIVTGSVFVNEFSRMDLDQTKLSGTYEFDGDRFI